MVQQLKTDLCSIVRELGYNITDNGAYVDNFPWLMVRLGGYNRADAADVRIDTITLVVDIFSKYKGEKEILDIVENITNNIWKLKDNNSNLIYVMQKDLKILDDNKTGPVKKHGVLTYWCLLSSSLGEEDADDTSGN